MKNLLTLFCLALFVLTMESTASAASATYALSLDGSQEFPGPGDLDGTGVGTITLDDVTGDVSWNITYADIVAPSAMHIHGPNGSAGSSAGVLIGLGVNTSGGAGTLIDSLTANTTDVASILANGANFYVNIHNSEFGPGAIRGQLGTLVPEPTGIVLLGMGLVGLLSRRSSSAKR